MKTLIFLIWSLTFMAAPLGAQPAEEKTPAEQSSIPAPNEYEIGVDDLIEISVIQPEKIMQEVVVGPDGFISFPYIGSLKVKGKTLMQVQEEIEAKLMDGYMKYPIVYVVLKESRSRKFFIYGEVIKPGTYLLEESITVLRAITIAGGFTKFGSANGVKLLRPKKGATGYETIKVNLRSIIDGDSQSDVALEPFDMIVVSQ